MAKPSKKKRSRSEVAEERVRVSEVILRKAALAYAAVSHLNTSDPRWRRCWRALQLAAFRVAEALSKTGGDRQIFAVAALHFAFRVQFQLSVYKPCARLVAAPLYGQTSHGRRETIRAPMSEPSGERWITVAEVADGDPETDSLILVRLDQGDRPLDIVRALRVSPRRVRELGEELAKLRAMEKGPSAAEQIAALQAVQNQHSTKIGTAEINAYVAWRRSAGAISFSTRKDGQRYRARAWSRWARRPVRLGPALGPPRRKSRTPPRGPSLGSGIVRAYAVLDGPIAGPANIKPSDAKAIEHTSSRRRRCWRTRDSRPLAEVTWSRLP